MPEVFTFQPEMGTVRPASGQVSVRAGCRWKGLRDVREAVEFAIDLVVELAETVGFELLLDADVSGGTVRFSPGVGDFSLENQVDIVRLLGGERTGVRVIEDSFTLIPVKSMTGVVG